MNLRQRQSGVALVLVLWLTALLSLVVGAFALASRVENLQARHLFEGTRARYAAEAGLHYAVYELRNIDPNTRWVPDGRSYAFEFQGARVDIQIVDETGKIDLNVADDAVLAGLFDSLGLDMMERDALIDAIRDWVDPDDLARLNGAEADEYIDAGFPYVPRNAPFESLAEIQQVMGMSYELYQRMEPSITIFSGRPTVNTLYAPESVLRSMPGMDEFMVAQFLDQRQMAGAGVDMPLMLPDGTSVVAEGGGLTYTVRSRATLESGAWAQVDATLRLGASVGRPFRILRWRDQEAS